MSSAQESVAWKSHWFVLGLALHYVVIAYNHTLSTFVNYTPQYYCQDAKFEGKPGCVSGNSCESGYAFISPRNDTTIVTEWGLVCEDRLYQPMATTLYFVGVTAGALVTGILADKVGRRPLVVVSLYVHAVLGVIISVFAKSFTVYIVLRVVQGFFVQGLQSCTYTLVLEMIPTQHRTAMGAIAEFYWALGLMVLALASFYIPQWRSLQLLLSITPAVISFTYIWFIPESKIWLQSKISKDQSQTNFDKGKTSHGEHQSFRSTADDEQQANQTKRGMKQFELETPRTEGVVIGREKYVLEVLWLSKSLRKYNIIMVINWFATMIGYFTITFHIPNLSGSRHINFFLGAVVEVVAYIIGYIVLSRLGRRLPLSAYQLLGGLISCSIAYIPYSWFNGAVTTTIALIGKGIIVSSFCCLNLYTSELFPTTVRAAALGHCGFWGRIGSLLAPQLVVLGDYTSPSVPLVAVGIIGICTSVMVLALPETLGRPLPNTLQDVENIQRTQKRRSKHLT